MHVNIKFNGCVYPINITEHTTYAELYQQLLAMVKSQHPRIQALKIVTNGKPLQNTNTRISGEDYQELRDASGINAVESRSAAPAVASAAAAATVAASDPEPVVASPVAASGRAGAPAGIPESVDDSSRKKRRCLEQLSTSLNTYFAAPDA